MKTAHGSNRKSNGIYTIHQRYIALIIAFACFHVLVQVGLQNKCIQQGNYKTTISVHNATTRNRDSFGEGIPLLRHTTIPKSSLPPVTIRHEENYRGSIDPCMEEYKRLVSDRTPGLTTEDMLRSRTYIGNRHRLATLASKFEVAPINAVVCGGSISLGHGVKTTYANRLQEWLNGRFPVSSGNENHKVINKGTHGADVSGMNRRFLVNGFIFHSDFFSFSFCFDIRTHLRFVPWPNGPTSSSKSLVRISIFSYWNLRSMIVRREQCNKQSPSDNRLRKTSLTLYPLFRYTQIRDRTT